MIGNVEGLARPAVMISSYSFIPRLFSLSCALEENSYSTTRSESAVGGEERSQTLRRKSSRAEPGFSECFIALRDSDSSRSR